jgi:hypothetical protein
VNPAGIKIAIAIAISGQIAPDRPDQLTLTDRAEAPQIAKKSLITTSLEDEPSTRTRT